MQSWGPVSALDPGAVLGVGCVADALWVQLLPHLLLLHCQLLRLVGRGQDVGQGSHTVRWND